MRLVAGRSRSAAIATDDALPAAGARVRGRLFGRILVAPMVLYAGALLVRLWAVGGVAFPINEGSAYYVAVARNLVEGRGLVSDALWSYATPPLVVPRPAFELWQPMATFVSAIPMALLEPTFSSAQLGAAVLGALVAPLCWAIAREVAVARQLDGRRAFAVAFGSGALAAVLGPFLLATAIPDSTTPFLVFGLVSCWLMPRALSGSRAYGVALGAALGLAYLSRLEAVYLALAFVLLVGTRWRLLLPVIAGGLVVAVPWLGRNALAFGTLFPGQAIENVFFTRNEDVFAYLDRPTFERFLSQGADTMVANIGRALSHDLIDVLLVRAAPVSVIGLVAALWLWRTGKLRSSALGGLVLSGVLTYLAISVVFPVATLWGTFEHAAGPFLAGLTICAVVGVDEFVARVRRLRGWGRSNAWLGPFALLVLTLPIALLQVVPLRELAASQAQRVELMAQTVSEQPDVPERVISDHPVWMSGATGFRYLALPDEPVENVVRLAANLGAPMIVVVEGRGRYPDAFRTTHGRACFDERVGPSGTGATGGVFVLRVECRP